MIQPQLFLFPCRYIDIEYETPDPKNDYAIKAITLKTPDPSDNHIFYIYFSKAYPDTVLLTQKFYFEDMDLKLFKRLSEKLQQQYFIDLRKTVYPLGVIVDTKDYEVTLRKLIFHETLTKQQFFDYFFNFANAFELCSIRFNEFRLSLLPE